MGEFLDRYKELCRQKMGVAEVAVLTEVEQAVVDRFKQAFPLAYRQMMDEGIEVLPLISLTPNLSFYLSASKRVVLTITDYNGDYLYNGGVISSEDELVKLVGKAVYINVFEA